MSLCNSNLFYNTEQKKFLSVYPWNFGQSAKFNDEIGGEDLQNY